jgi:hypothetical protein
MRGHAPARPHAAISVPPTLKCSALNKFLSPASVGTAASSRPRFFLNTVTSYPSSSISKPTNQRNSKL